VTDLQASGPSSDADRTALRTFRRIADDVRRALPRATSGELRLRVVDGYIESEGWIEQFRPLCVPVRRTVMRSDSAYVGTIARILHAAAADPAHAEGGAAVSAQYAAVVREMETASTLGGRRITHGDLLRAWLDAAVFYDSTDKRRPYEDMVQDMGKAVEGIAMHLTLDIAAVLLSMDDLAADWIGEPRGVMKVEPPPPPPRPPRAWARLGRALAGLSPFRRKKRAAQRQY
jgi:hypothetical protein